MVKKGKSTTVSVSSGSDDSSSSSDEESKKGRKKKVLSQKQSDNVSGSSSSRSSDSDEDSGTTTTDSESSVDSSTSDSDDSSSASSSDEEDKAVVPVSKPVEKMSIDVSKNDEKKTAVSKVSPTTVQGPTLVPDVPIISVPAAEVVVVPNVVVVVKSEVKESKPKKPRKVKTKVPGRRSVGNTKIILKLPCVNGRRQCPDHLLQEEKRKQLLKYVWDMLHKRKYLLDRTREQAALSAPLSSLLPFSFTNETDVLFSVVELRAKVDWKVQIPSLHVNEPMVQVDIYLLSSLGMPTVKLMKIPSGRHAIVIADSVQPCCMKDRRKDLEIFPSHTFLHDYSNHHYHETVKPHALWTDQSIEPVLERYDRNQTHYPHLMPTDPIVSYSCGTRVPKMMTFDRVSTTAGIYRYHRIPIGMATAPPTVSEASQSSLPQEPIFTVPSLRKRKSELVETQMTSLSPAPPPVAELSHVLNTLTPFVVDQTTKRPKMI